MEEKISFQRPRPFSSGFIIPLLYDKQPIQINLELKSLEVLPKAIAVHMPASKNSTKFMKMIDEYARTIMKKYNRNWFQNNLTDVDLDERFIYTISSDDYMTIPCNVVHPPKKMLIDDKACVDWTHIVSSVQNDTLEAIYLSVICHGIYVQKKGFSLLYKPQDIHIHTASNIEEETDIDDIKEDVETYWDQEIEEYSDQVNQEIHKLEESIRIKKGRVEKLRELIGKSKNYSSKNPEWNFYIHAIQEQLQKYKAVCFIQK